MYCQGTKFEWCSSSVTSDDVAGPEIVEAPGVGDEIDALGCAVGEDQLARLRRVHEARDLLASAFVFGGRHLRERVDAAMDVRVRGLVERAELVEHLARLVRAHRRVEVGERLAPDLLLEDREVRAELARVQLRLRRHGHPVIVPGGSSGSGPRPGLPLPSSGSPGTSRESGTTRRFASQGRLAFVSLRIRIDDSAKGDGIDAIVDEPEEQPSERLRAVLDPPRALLRVHDQRLGERRLRRSAAPARSASRPSRAAVAGSSRGSPSRRR